jgi:hypothetical protein
MVRAAGIFWDMILIRQFLALAFFGVLLCAPAQAADALFPKGSRIGLAPFTGLEISRTFPGFEDSTNKVLILLTELPAQAYEATLKSMQTPPAGTPGVTNIKREILLTSSGAAHLISANQEQEGQKVRKWMLVTWKSGTDFTALITALVPDAAKNSYNDATMRKIFASLSLRDEIPKDEVLSLLPFEVAELANFRTIRPIGGGRGILLSDEVKPAAAPDTDKKADADKKADGLGEEPEMIVSINPGAPAQPEDRARFAEQLISAMPGLKDVRTVLAEPMRLGSLPGYEIRLEAKSTRSGKEVNIVQWVRFGTSSFIHIVGISPRERWADTFPRFRAVRDGIGVR